MITYTISGDNVPVDDTVRDHVENHFKKFEKFVDPERDHEMFVTFSKSTAHHREDSFRCEVEFKINSESYFVQADNANILSAVDEAKDGLLREITKKHGKERTAFARGARKIKTLAKVLNGFGKKK